MPIATNSSRLNISKEKDTKKTAEIFSKNIQKGDVVFFYGEVGVGKTTFIKYFINYLQKLNGEKITEIPSPTFSILNEYKLNEIEIVHLDLYRLKNKEELENLAIFEDISNKILLIEWPEILKEKPVSTIDLYFKYDEDLNSRFLILPSEYQHKFEDEIK